MSMIDKSSIFFKPDTFLEKTLQDNGLWRMDRRSYRRKMLMRTVSTTLTRIMEVMGMKTRVRPEVTRMSPGSFPNQVTSQGAAWSTAPITIKTTPAMISHRPMQRSAIRGAAASAPATRSR